MNLNDYASEAHEANKRWWDCLYCEQLRFVTADDVSPMICPYCAGTGSQKRNLGELLMLAVSELAEALEGARKGLQDYQLPQYKMFDGEIVECFIRLFDIAGVMIPDLQEIYDAKMEFKRGWEDARN